MARREYRNINKNYTLEQALIDVLSFEGDQKGFEFFYNGYLFRSDMTTNPKFRELELYAQQILDEIQSDRLSELFVKYKINPNQEITEERINEAMTYLCVNANKSYTEILEGLLRKGLYWSFNRIYEQYGDGLKNVNEGLANGNLVAAACVISNIFDGYFSYKIIKDQYLDYDTVESCYQYIRSATGNNEFMKDLVIAENQPSIRFGK